MRLELALPTAKSPRVIQSHRWPNSAARRSTHRAMCLREKFKLRHCPVRADWPATEAILPHRERAPSLEYFWHRDLIDVTNAWRSTQSYYPPAEHTTRQPMA